MIEKQTKLLSQPLSNERMIESLNNDYGLKISKLIPLALGADMNAWVYKAQSSNRLSYFVKLRKGHHDDLSVNILSLLQDAGVKQIIAPFKTVEGQFTQLVEDFTLLVYPFVEGRDGFKRDLSDDQWVMLGKVLRHVHECHVPLTLQNRLRRETYSPRWRERVRSLYAYIETRPSGDKIALNFLKVLQEQAQVIERLVNKSEELAKKVQKQPTESVLCHSDIHGGNVLIDEKGAFFIVDWDDPIMAPKERDLMFIGGGVANVWNKPHEVELFYKGYGATKIDQTILAYYRHERIIQDIAEYGEALLLSGEGGEERPEMYQHFMAMFEPRGVVEIAFKT